MRQVGGKRFIRFCSVCKGAGHDRRSCPTLAEKPHVVCNGCGACTQCGLPHGKDCPNRGKS